MRKQMWAGGVATFLGTVSAIACLVKTTALTMTLFFFVGVPCLAAGFILYVTAVLKDLKDHKVL